MVVINSILFLCIIFYNTDAYAYIDPGTGGIILQVIIGAIATIGIFFNKAKKKIKDKFIKLKSVFKKN